ncbi:DUF3054 domain-containing protein [Arthrobacter sp. Y-9]|uniref:DUF3054 domain-containing protein n=1 Tax=Arthrobacter sp. Y-9 TaxID=3039385 RepID=UPI00241DB3BA|nr:DUF3054 domain-containing protein [Arthrobacter sp. Y-9]WFR85502.1 DUF3054 domain-containing protein [Arthrobacter sp. Y-9]
MNSPSKSILTAAIVLDVVLILVFAGIGRDAHHRDQGVLGVFVTAWPFLAGALIGWLAGRVWRAPLRLWSAGVSVWLGSLIGGMILRALTGQVVVLPFIIVATLFLALVLLGWRAIWLLAVRVGSKRRAL